MEVDIKKDCIGVNWKTVSETLKCVGMGYHEPDVHKKAFEASHTKVFAYHDDRLIGFGRAISDGAYQAAIYDCAVLPEFPGEGNRKDYHEQHLIPTLALQHHFICVTGERRILPNTQISENENGYGALYEKCSNERTRIHGISKRMTAIRI